MAAEPAAAGRIGVLVMASRRKALKFLAGAPMLPLGLAFVGVALEIGVVSCRSRRGLYVENLFGVFQRQQGIEGRTNVDVLIMRRYPRPRSQRCSQYCPKSTRKKWLKN